jgi:transposase
LGDERWSRFLRQVVKVDPMNLITQWRRQAIEKLARVFDDKGLEVQANRDAEVTKLHAKIGQLVVERDFLAKAFDR